MRDMDNLGWLIPVIIVAVIVIAALVWFFATRARLQSASVRVDEAWNDIADQIKRRSDLVPSLISSVSEYTGERQQVFGELSAASDDAVASTGPMDAAQAEDRFQGALRSLFGLATGYPQLTQNPNFLQLKADLVQTEDKIQTARRNYNGTVRGFNRQVTAFPNRIVAGSAHAHPRDFYEVNDRAAISEPPRVQF